MRGYADPLARWISLPAKGPRHPGLVVTVMMALEPRPTGKDGKEIVQ